jgi:hypothetical protein
MQAVEEYVHAESTLRNRTYFSYYGGRSEISQSSYGLGALGRKYGNLF